MKTSRSICVFLSCWFAAVTPLSAAVVALTATDTGFFNAAGRSSKNDGATVADATFNYSAGAIDEASPLSGSDVPRKNYFTFDLTAVTETITSAKLDLFLPSTGFGSPDGTEAFSLYGSIFPGSAEMSAFATSLRTVYSIFVPGELMTAADKYTKLGDTKLSIMAFATKVMSAADAGLTVSLEFTGTGISYLNAYKGGSVVLSGELDTLNGVTGTDEFVFGFSKPLISGVVSPDPSISGPTPTPTLELTTVPEPATYALASGLLLLGFAFLRRMARPRLQGR